MAGSGVRRVASDGWIWGSGRWSRMARSGVLRPPDLAILTTPDPQIQPSGPPAGPQIQPSGPPAGPWIQPSGHPPGTLRAPSGTVLRAPSGYPPGTLMVPWFYPIPVRKQQLAGLAARLAAIRS